MLYDLLWVSAAILIGILLLHPRVLGAVRGFDARNRARIAAEQKDRRDALAHFRRTLELASEQVEPVQSVSVADDRTGTAVTRYLFEGQAFATEAEARERRDEKVRIIARGFYMDLPAALRARKDDEKLGRDR